MIYIITPCSRAENLEQISSTIPTECQWVIVYDDKVKILQPIKNAWLMKCHDTGMVGIKAQNFALDTLPLNDNDYILYHDDDNIIHHNLYPTISNFLNFDFSIMTWGQLLKNNTVRLPPVNKPEVGKIDTASFLISWKYNKNVRHKIGVYEHDGIYARDCAKNGPTLCINDYLCYYNYLRDQNA